MAISFQRGISNSSYTELSTTVNSKELQRYAADEDREFRRLKREMEAITKKVEQSIFFKKLLHEVETEPYIKTRIYDALGPYNDMPMVIYGLGSVQYNFVSQFRLALALLLRRHLLPPLISNIEVCLPNSNSIEDGVLRDLRCDVVHDDEQCRRRVERPTLLFMSHVDGILLGNFFEANWCSSILNRVIMLSNSIEYMVREINGFVDEEEEGPRLVIDKISLKIERMRYLWAVKKHVEEFEIDKESRDRYNTRLKTREYYLDEEEEDRQLLIDTEYKLENPFATFGWHFFNFNSNVNMELLLPSIPAKIRLQTVCTCRLGYGPCLCKYMDEEDVDESERLSKEIQLTIGEVKETQFFADLKHGLADREIVEKVSQVLGSKHKQLTLVLYGIPSLEISTMDYQYFLALALLLRQDSLFPIGDIEVMDLEHIWTPVDHRVMLNLQCKVLSTDDRCWRRVDKPTIFFITRVAPELIANLMEANFSPSRLSQMILIGRWRNYGMELVSRRNRHLHLRTGLGFSSEERSRYEWALRKHSITYRMDDIEEESRSLFSRFYIRFFSDMSLDIHLQNLLPSVPLKAKLRGHLELDSDATESIYEDWVMDERRELKETMLYCFQEEKITTIELQNIIGWHRGLKEARQKWSKPPPGWTQLNFSGEGFGRDGRVGFGGVFRDEHGEQLLAYAGALAIDEEGGNDGSPAAAVEALRQGLRCLERLPEHCPRKFVIQGDDLRVVRWTNELFPEPPRFRRAFDEIFHLKKNGAMVFAFLYVYEEDNSMARDLAFKGAELEELSIW